MKKLDLYSLNKQLELISLIHKQIWTQFSLHVKIKTLQPTYKKKSDSLAYMLGKYE